MGREIDCDPELSLRLGTGLRRSSAADSADSSTSPRVRDSKIHEKQQQSQQITIFHNGRLCVCDVTEIQARAIICMARREMMETSTEEEEKKRGGGQVAGCRPSDHQHQLIINPALSMKRSLQRFLQKRKARMDSASPYHHWDPRSPPSPYPA